MYNVCGQIVQLWHQNLFTTLGLSIVNKKSVTGYHLITSANIFTPLVQVNNISSVHKHIYFIT